MGPSVFFRWLWLPLSTPGRGPSFRSLGCRRMQAVAVTRAGLTLSFGRTRAYKTVLMGGGLSERFVLHHTGPRVWLDESIGFKGGRALRGTFGFDALTARVRPSCLGRSVYISVSLCQSGPEGCHASGGVRLEKTVDSPGAWRWIVIEALVVHLEAKQYGRDVQSRRRMLQTIKTGLFPVLVGFRSLNNLASVTAATRG